MFRKKGRAAPTWARWVIGIVVGVIVLNAGLTLLREMYGGPQGKPSSSYATAPEGTAAFAELLAGSGYPVVPLRGALSGDRLPASGVLIVLDPETLTDDEVRALQSWVRTGGRLVIGGRPELWSDGLIGRGLRWSPAGVLVARPLATVAETTSVGSIGGEGYGTWEDSGPALPIFGLESASARTVVSVAAIGAGDVVLLADTSVLHNRYLAKADNAAFALNLAGPPATPVYFAEGVHGYGNETGLMAIPLRWKVALGGLALASVVWMIAVGRRLGPAEPEARDLAPPRRAYVDALTTTLARTKKPDEVVAPVRAAVRSRIAQRAGLDDRAEARALEGAGRSLGLGDDEIRAVFGDGDPDVVAVGRALAKLGSGPW